MKKGIRIKNIRILNPSDKTDKIGDIYIRDEKIERIIIDSEDAPEEEGFELIEGTGLIAAPGLVDVHVHFRDPGLTYKEDIHSGALCAAGGGFTSVVMMANTKPPIDNPSLLRDVLERAGKEDINIYCVGNITKGMEGQELADLKALKEAGAAGFSDDGRPILSEELIIRAFKEAASLEATVSLHEEDPEFIDNNGINRGAVSKRLGIGGSDRMAEISMVKRDVGIALETGVSLDIQHISTKEAVELVRQGKKAGGRIYAEATPHHFTLTDSAVLEYGSLAKMNPPLREEADRLAIIEGLKDGTIDMIATDHAPHSREEKATELTKAPSGIIGLQTALSLSIEELCVKGGLSLLKLMELMSLSPARIYGLDAGELKEGGRADLVIFDPEEKWVFRREDCLSKSENSPFFDKELKGRVRYTICRGRIVYRLENSEDTCFVK